MNVHDFAAKVQADYTRLLQRERGLPATPPPPPERLVHKVISPAAPRSTPMTSDTMTATDVRKALARRDRLTAAEQQAVADWIVRHCLDTPDQAAVRKVLARVRAELPARVALSVALAAVRVRAEHARTRPVVNVGSQTHSHGPRGVRRSRASPLPGNPPRRYAEGAIPLLGIERGHNNPSGTVRAAV
jgi:hypothetical protein